MIELIESFPDQIVGFIGKGQVTKSDYEQVLIPKLDEALKRHKKIRLYYELGSEFKGIEPGAAWDDLKLSIEHYGSWDRAALVTDVGWISEMVKAFRFIMPGELRVFPVAQTSEARAWIQS